MLRSGPHEQGAPAMDTNNGLPLVAPRVTPVLDPGLPPGRARHARLPRARRARRRAPCPCGWRSSRPTARCSASTRACCPTSHPQAAANGPLSRALRQVPPVVARRLAHLRRRPGAAGRAAGSALPRHRRPARFDARSGGRADVRPSARGRAHARPAGRALGRPSRSAGTWRAAASASISAAATARWRRSSTAASSSAKRRSGIPYHKPDPQYHFDGIMDSLTKAAAHLPRVDAIGGSAAGVYVNNRVKAGSLFRGVPQDAVRRAREGPVPRDQEGLERRAVRGRQRRRGHGAGRLDVARQRTRSSASRSAPARPPATSRRTATSRRG